MLSKMKHCVHRYLLALVHVKMFRCTEVGGLVYVRLAITSEVVVVGSSILDFILKIQGRIKTPNVFISTLLEGELHLRAT